MKLSAGISKRLVLTQSGGLDTDTWQLLQIQTLQGEEVGLDADGVALTYPLDLEKVEGQLAWYTAEVQLAEAGQYLAVFQSSSSRVKTELLDVEQVFTYTAGVNVSTTGSYASVLDMVNRFGADHMAELGDPNLPRVVTGEMLSTAVSGGDMTIYSEQEQAATENAVNAILIALQDATTLIEGHLRGRYLLPLESAPATVVRWACDLARYTLHRTGAPDYAKEQADQALKQLERVSMGKLDLGLTPAQEPAANAADIIVLEGATRVFSPTTLADF
jgi:phage gp36-like protein